MIRRHVRRLAVLAFAVATLATGLPAPAWAGDEAPDALIQRLSDDTMGAIKGDKSVRSGDINHVIALVDSKLMPNVDFQRMTSAAVGPAWRQATAEQKSVLQREFKSLLVRTYSGALSQVTDQVIKVKPVRMGADDKEVVVRTKIRGHGEPVQLEYRLEKTPGQGAGWKIYNLNVLGVWLVETYRGQFAREVNLGGVDGLIAALIQRNNSNAGARESRP